MLLCGSYKDLSISPDVNYNPILVVIIRLERFELLCDSSQGLEHEY